MTRASKALLALCVSLYAFHLFHVWRNAVNLPVFDEWELFNPDQLPGGLTPGWLFAQHNEHRMSTNKLLIWALYHVNGWDVAGHQVLNFLLYGAAVALIFLFARSASPETPAWVVLGFSLFLLTTIGIQNHAMALQSAFHFWLLFFLLSARLLFASAQGTRVLVAGGFCSALSVFSLASGVVSAVVLLLAFAVFKLPGPRPARGREVSAMRISVALCTYNGERFLQEQLDSIAAQARLPDELVVCDDSSTDGTRQLVESFAAVAPFPVRLRVNEVNVGSTRNFDRAITHCTGELIALCDQDDVWLPEKLRRFEQVFEADAGVGLVFSDAEIVGADLSPTGRRLWDWTCSPRPSGARCNGTPSACSCGATS